MFAIITAILTELTNFQSSWYCQTTGLFFQKIKKYIFIVVKMHNIKLTILTISKHLVQQC